MKSAKLLDRSGELGDVKSLDGEKERRSCGDFGIRGDGNDRIGCSTVCSACGTVLAESVQHTGC